MHHKNGYSDPYEVIYAALCLITCYYLGSNFIMSLSDFVKNKRTAATDEEQVLVTWWMHKSFPASEFA